MSDRRLNSIESLLYTKQALRHAALPFYWAVLDLSDSSNTFMAHVLDLLRNDATKRESILELSIRFDPSVNFQPGFLGIRCHNCDEQPCEPTLRRRLHLDLLAICGRLESL